MPLDAANRVGDSEEVYFENDGCRQHEASGVEYLAEADNRDATGSTSRLATVQ
jgi:hypothetical protein